MRTNGGCRIRLAGFGSEHSMLATIPVNDHIPVGPEWESLRNDLLAIHDEALGGKQSLNDLKARAGRIAAHLAVAFWRLKRDPARMDQFQQILRGIKGSDFFGKFVKFALHAALDNEWISYKGFLEQIVAAVRVADKEYLFRPNLIPTWDSTHAFIMGVGHGDGRRTGLDACWSILKDMQRADKEAQRRIQEEKNELYIREKARQKQEAEKADAERLGLSLEDYHQREEQRLRSDYERERMERIETIHTTLLSSSLPWSGGAPSRGTLLISDGTHIRIVADDQRDELLSCKLALLNRG
jgi:hypothetical protein